MKLLTVAEVSIIFRVGTRTIMRWMANGKLKSVQIGHRHLFKSTYIKKILNGGT